MLEEAKLALRVTATEYDKEIASLLSAGARDLEAAGVVLPGTVSFAYGAGAVTDNSTLTDELVQRAIITYARMHFGSPPDYDKVAASYELQKSTLMHASDYTDYGGDADAES